ncbi:YegS/Rv2252/BmrU family lipid kinase [Nocardia paucivorans]|uniref:YegS/Rv2252/BmrU family lipid kinase n=1 Tax=Nocardia paucivorans TaxID=114259 RepID=UPI0002D4A1C8|nr:YegS/Rv2252/BmrU family lipid kinase [Nocardia paucivorans]
MTEPQRGAVRAATMVTNPMAGHGRGRDTAASVAARLIERGIEVGEVHGSSVAETLARLRENLVGSHPDVVVCVGGDGMVSVILDGLAHGGIPLALVPCGTGNDLAREFGIPDDDPVAAADLVLDGRVRDIDLGLIEFERFGSGIGADRPSAGDTGSMWFATVAATGFDARVTLRANRMRRPHGSLRYSLAALVELVHGTTVPYHIELSHRGVAQATILDTEAVMVAVGNTGTYGGGMRICPDAVVDDGQLEVTVVGAVSRPEMLRLLPALASGRRVDHPAVTRYRAEWLRLDSPGAPVTADGEPAGTLPVTMRSVPRALSLLVPS